MIGCGWWTEDTAPADLEGVWVTDAPRYARCSFELRRDMIVFNNAQGHADINFIQRIETRLEKGTHLYSITYKDRKGQTFILAFYHEQTTRGGHIRFKNQKNIRWRRLTE